MKQRPQLANELIIVEFFMNYSSGAYVRYTCSSRTTGDAYYYSTWGYERDFAAQMFLVLRAEDTNPTTTTTTTTC